MEKKEKEKILKFDISSRIFLKRELLRKEKVKKEKEV
jgi:hypothetical protein